MLSTPFRWFINLLIWLLYQLYQFVFGMSTTFSKIILCIWLTNQQNSDMIVLTIKKGGMGIE